MKSRRRSFIIAGLSFAIVSLAGCTKNQPPPSPPPPAVTVITTGTRDVVEWDEYIGRLESVQTVEIRARVSGYLHKIHFQEGKEVKKGDPLFTIDPRPYQAILDRTEAEHQRAVARADLAKVDFERSRALIATRAISQEDYDTRAQAYAEALAAVKSAMAAVDTARLDLEFTDIRSPIDGRTSRALITEGNLIGGTSVLTTIVSLDPMYCYVDVDERSLQKYIRLNNEGRRASPRYEKVPVEMGLATDAGHPRKGYADFVDNRVDPGTGTMRARGVFENKDKVLSPGFFARLRVPGSEQYPAILLPDRALGSDQSEKFVYVVTAGNQVEFRPVKIGPIIDGLRVIRQGLQPGEMVIVEGLMRVRPGIIVNPQPAGAL